MHLESIMKAHTHTYPPGEALPNRHRDVVIVDDDRSDRESLKSFFHRIDPSQNVRLFKNGLDFLCYMENFRDQDQMENLPRLVILDLLMPIKNGVDTLKEFRNCALWQEIPVILLSGSDDDHMILEAEELGANAFISKPFHGLDLAQAIHRGFNFTSKVFV